MHWCGRKKTKKILRMKPSDILVFDLETTGLLLTDEILQIALVDGDGNLIFSSYVRPDHKKTWKSAEKINGISPSMVHDAPKFGEIKSQVQNYFNKAKLIVGYNSNRFDIPFIERYGIVVPSNRFDLMEEFRLYTQRNSRSKLSDCADYCNVYYNPHDAEEDARATAKCMQILLQKPGFVNMDPPKKRVKDKKNTSEEITMPQLSEESEPIRKKFSFKGILVVALLRCRQCGLIGVALLLLIIGICGIWKYGNIHIINWQIQQMSLTNISSIISILMCNTYTKVSTAIILVGGTCFIIGVLNKLMKCIYWLLNLPKRLFK